jgi:hypothetical protein
MLCIHAVCVPVYYVLFTHSYVAFNCGQAFQFRLYILLALTLVSVSDNLDSKRLLHGVTADIRVLYKVGLDTFM